MEYPRSCTLPAVMEAMLLGVVLLALGYAIWAGARHAQDATRLPLDRLAELESMVKAYRRDVDELEDHVGRWGQRVTKRETRDAGTSATVAAPVDRAELRRQLRSRWDSSRNSRRA